VDQVSEDTGTHDAGKRQGWGKNCDAGWGRGLGPSLVPVAFSSQLIVSFGPFCLLKLIY